MSTSARRTPFFLIAVIAVAVIAAAGFYAGRRASAPMQTAKPDSIGAQGQQTAEWNGPRMIDTPYRIIQPSMGLLQRTVAVALSVDGRQASAPPDPAVAETMDVILYDAQGFALSGKGRVARSDGSGIAIDLPDYASPPVRGAVIVEQNAFARRLPLSAQTGGSVWKATLYPDGSATVTRIALPDTYLHNERLFHIGAGLRADEYALLDPAADLREGDILTNVTPAGFEAPVLDAADTARKEVEALRMAAMLYVLETAPVEVFNPDGTFTCAAPSSLTSDP